MQIKKKIFKWLTAFNNNLSKNVSNNAAHSYIIIDDNFLCSSHKHIDINKMPAKNIWYQKALKAEFDKNIYILTNFKGDVVFTTFNIDLVINEQYRFYNVIKEIEKRNTKVGLIHDKYSISLKYGIFYLYDKSNHFVSMVAVPLSVINGSFNRLFLYYIIMIIILALIVGIIYYNEKKHKDKIDFSNNIINIVGSPYYLILCINIKQDRYIRIKCSEDIIKFIPADDSYSNINKLISMVVEKGTQLDFTEAFSIENIRKLTESDKVDFGGDFQYILMEGYKWINIRLLYDKAVEKDYAVLCFKERDIEKKRELEHIELLEESVEAMKNANMSKSMFYSGLSHDMRTPLNAIIGLTDLVKYNIKDEIKINDYMDKIKSAGNQLITLIDNFLDYSKNEYEKIDNEIVNFNLKEYLEENTAIFKVIAKNEDKKFIFKYNVKHNNKKAIL